MKLIKNFKEWISFHYNAHKHGKNLILTQDNLKSIKPEDIILFAVMKNESFRLPYFIDYYRKLGVNHFIFVNNASTDNFNNIIKKQSDITTFYTVASYKNAKFGIHWINSLLSRFGRKHWCLICDPDEFLVYPYIENKSLRDLTNHLDIIKQDSFFTVLVDMYSDKTIEETHYKEGSDPLKVCPYFDGESYTQEYSKNYKHFHIQGGVRRRMFYTENPKKSPALHKISLIKWKFDYAYVSSTHMLIPRKLNQVVGNNITSGALLHYKFISQLEQKISEEEKDQQHYDNSSEYKRYAATMKTRTILYNSSISYKYENWKSLEKFGFVNQGKG